MKSSLFVLLTCAVAILLSLSLAGAAVAGAGKVCPISGEAIEEGAPTADFQGQTVEFCCKSCLRKWQAMDDSARTATLAKWAAPESPAPAEGHALNNDVCPISGNKVDPAAPTALHKGWTVSFCCAMCPSKFEAMDEEKKDAFVIKFVPQSPVNELCPIGKEPVVADGGSAVYKGQVVGFCCPSCEKGFMGWDEAKRDAFVAQYTDRKAINSICPIGLDPIPDETLYAMHFGQKIAFCCPHCQTKWQLMTITERGDLVAKMEKNSEASH